MGTRMNDPFVLADVARELVGPSVKYVSQGAFQVTSIDWVNRLASGYLNGDTDSPLTSIPWLNDCYSPRIGDYARCLVYDNNIVLLGTTSGSEVFGPVGARVAHGEITTTSGAFAALTSIPGLTATFVSPGDRIYRIHVHLYAQGTVSGDTSRFLIGDASNNTISLGGDIKMDASTVNALFDWEFEDIPAAGTTVYQVRGQRLAGTGTLTVLGAANNISYISVYDAGNAND